MSKIKKIAPIEIHLERQCINCGIKLIAAPPCPRCGSEFQSFMSKKTHVKIMDFLKRHKGSQCRIYRGKNNNNKEILLYELLTKKQLDTE